MRDWLRAWPVAIRSCLIGARDLIVDSAPLLAWRRADPGADAPAQHPRPLLCGSRVHTLLCPRFIRLDAASWGVKLIAWIHTTLGAIAGIPWNPKRQKNRSCLPSTWTKEESGKRSSIERFFGRVFLFFRLQRPPFAGWSTVARHVALTYTATIIVALAAQRAGRPDLIRSSKRVLSHPWEGF